MNGVYEFIYVYIEVRSISICISWKRVEPPLDTERINSLQPLFGLK